MKKFEEKKFNIPELKGISAKNIEEHLKLYAGYVKNLNLIQEIIDDKNHPEYALSETQRRQGFEFGGMRNHEYYFAHFEGGSKPLSPDSELYTKISEWKESIESFIETFKNLASTRGVGWAILGYDKKTDSLISYWVDEQHLGHLPEVSPLLCLDMWEHSFVADYNPSGKKQYIEDFFSNLNWDSVSKNFSDAR